MVGCGKDPWYGSEMGMKIKYSRRKRTCTYNETCSIKDIIKDETYAYIFLYKKDKKKIGSSVFF